MPEGLLDFAASEAVTSAKMDKLAKQAVVDCNNASKPSLNEGGVLAVVDTDRLEVYDGSAYQRVAQYAAAGRTGGLWSRAAAQTATATTEVAVSWDTEAFDSDGFLTPHATTGTTITIPSSLGGLYVISPWIDLSGDPGNLSLFVKAVMSGTTRYYGFAASSAAYLPTTWEIGTTVVLRLSAADTVQIIVRASDTTPRTFTGRLNVERIAI